MALETPLYMQPASGDSAIQYSARQDRAGLLSSVFSREGVLDKDAGHLLVSQRSAGANMSVDVAAGRCALFGDDISDQGTYLCTNTTPVNVTVPTRPASGSRTHRVIARVRDKLSNGVWSGYDWTIELLADTGSGTPAQPNTAITLALVTVSSSATSVTNAMISDQRLRSSVGSPWLTGSMLESGINAAYGGRDATRPLTWTKNPDGWVFLAGWIRRSGGETAIAGGSIYNFDGTSGVGTGAPILPPEARPTGTRDVVMMTREGPTNLAIYANGSMSFRYYNNVTLYAGGTASASWFSFDGVSFRASAFS